MDEALHRHDELPITSGMGWLQMELLLNKSLPVKKEFSFIRMLGSYLPAVLVSILFLFSSLQLNNTLSGRTIASNTIFINQDQAIFSSLNYNEQKYSANTITVIK